MTTQILKYKDILKFATDAHGDQKRKYTNQLYITHPIEVAKLVEEEISTSFTKSIPHFESMIYASLLHDVLEDTEVTYEELRAFLFRTLTLDKAKKTLDLVIELTDIFTTESFPELNRAKRKDLEATRLGGVSLEAKLIKRMDMNHNTKSILQNDPKFAKVYLKEKNHLLKFL